MNYATIKWTDIANGEGIRISLFVSGCTHRCKNCFNQVAWDFEYGEHFDEAVQEKILKEFMYSSQVYPLAKQGNELAKEKSQGLCDSTSKTSRVP